MQNYGIFSENDLNSRLWRHIHSAFCIEFMSVSDMNSNLLQAVERAGDFAGIVVLQSGWKFAIIDENGRVGF